MRTQWDELDDTISKETCDGITMTNLSGRIGMVVASHEEGCGLDSPQRLHRSVMCKRRSRGAALQKVIGSTVSDAVVGC